MAGGSLDHMEGPACPIAQSWVVPSGNRATGKRRPVVEKDTIYVALDDSKRKLVVAILRPGAPEPEEREIPKDPPHIQRLCRRLQREGPCRRATKRGSRGTTSTARSLRAG